VSGRTSFPGTSWTELTFLEVQLEVPKVSVYGDGTPSATTCMSLKTKPRLIKEVQLEVLGSKGWWMWHPGHVVGKRTFVPTEILAWQILGRVSVLVAVFVFIFTVICFGLRLVAFMVWLVVLVLLLLWSIFP
jgi:hypothetical protein